LQVAGDGRWKLVDVSLLDSSLSEGEILLKKGNEDEIRLLWDGILNILLERVHRKSISDSELTHLVEELTSLFRAVKGKNGTWGSVLDVTIVLLNRDASIHEFCIELPYNESTIYRALRRLELAGFAAIDGRVDERTKWTIDKTRCPVLYRASRRS
jgi:hypothetical protein